MTAGAHRTTRRARRGRQLRYARVELLRKYATLGCRSGDARLLAIAADNPCPCGECGGRGDFPVGARYLPGWADCVPAEVRAVHDAHTSRVLALWALRVALPESARRAALRLLALSSVALRDARRVLLLAPVADRLRARGEHLGGRLPVAQWLEVCRSHGPPAVAVTAAPGAPVI
jgi:hypothetical protein